MKILFVCSANICRSALCEVVLRQKLKEREITGVEVDSAGVHDYAGEPRDSTMRAYAQKAGYELSGKSKYITKVCFEERTSLPDPSGDTGYMYAYVLQRVVEGCDTLSWKISKMMGGEEEFL